MNKRADYDPMDYIGYARERSIQGEYGLGYYEGKADMANDILKIVGMGFSGTFIYDDERKIVLSTDNPISIEPSIIQTHYPHQYVVTDQKGVKYYFSVQEQSVHEYYYNRPELDQRKDSIRYTSAWHLTKIKNDQNDSIIFTYHQKERRISSGPISGSWYLVSNYRMSAYTPKKQISTGKTIYYPQVLKTIENNSTKVTFNYIPNSDSEFHNEIIDNIEISTKGAVNKIVKQYKFSYIKGQSGKTFLSKIELFNEKLYEFEYHTVNFDEGNYPHFDQDFCGYYNGANNSTIIPHYGVIYGEDADRSVNPNAAFRDALKTIIYPTGGRCELTWESNDFKYLNRTEVATSDSQSSYDYEESSCIDELVGLMPESLRKLTIENYNVTATDKITLDLTRYFCFDPTLLYNTEYEWLHEDGLLTNYPSVSFTRITTNMDEQPIVFYIDKNTVEERFANKEFDVSLKPGIYKIELQYPTNVHGAKEEIERQFRYDYGTCGRVFIKKYTYRTPLESDGIIRHLWGGLRISRIKSTGDDTSPIIKDYFYNKTFSPYETSGVVSQLPFYFYMYYIMAYHTLVVGIDATEVQCLSANGLYNTPIGWQGVQYPEVSIKYSVEDRLDPTYGNYNETYHYTSCKDKGCQDRNDSDFLGSQPRGGQMWTTLSHRHGILKAKNTGGGDSTIYEYNVFESNDLKEFTTDLFVVGDYNATITAKTICPYDFGIGKYTLIPYNKTVKRERYTEAEGFETETEYEYFYNEYTDKLDRNLVKAKRTTDSDGSPRTVYYTYLMAAQNLALDYPETEVTVVDGKIVDASRMEYDEHRRLKAVYGLSVKGADASAYGLGGKSASAKLRELISRPEYSYKYDYRGNLAEISYNGMVLASYLWGYMGSYPIVEAKFLPHSRLVAAAGQADGLTVQSLLDGSFTSAAQLNGFFTKLRAQLPTTELTTITYHWLLGISEGTDPRGVKTTFTYDRLGRLSGIKDYNDYFIKKYLYHFKEN